MKELGGGETANQKKDEYIMLLTNTISELQQKIEEQKREISELKNQISGYCEEIIRINNLYQEKREKNKDLVEQWNSQHCNQEKRIQEALN
ncbi:19741_t:CDS:2 [Dentiscutata erythropus]|uniref:19741_t:CDS:1 n=1 Tax=Dentiscutata erythropus TaxID=1348616 RepID=A0A9N9HTC1_9GLOM|nr:19741_t:CDS:2 [Dentiscutata erythropus]